MDEYSRLAAAKPEIDKYDQLEKDLLHYEQTLVFSPAQLVTLLSERRKIIDGRSLIKGIVPKTVVVAGSEDDYGSR